MTRHHPLGTGRLLITFMSDACGIIGPFLASFSSMRGGPTLTMFLAFGPPRRLPKHCQQMVQSKDFLEVISLLLWWVLLGVRLKEEVTYLETKVTG